MKLSLLFSTLAALALPSGLSSDDLVTLERGVSFYGIEAPSEANAGQTVEIDLYFSADEALDERDFAFLHLEGRTEDGEVQKRCRVVRDLPLERDADSGGFTVHAKIEVLDTCEPGSLEIYTGVWNRRTHQRRALTSRSTLDDRIHAGYIELVEGTPSDERRATAPSSMRWREIWQRFDPWWGWIFGVLVMLGLALAARRFTTRVGAARAVDPELVADDDDSEDQRLTEAQATAARERGRLEPVLAWLGARPPRWLFWGSLALLLVPLMASILAALDFIKDDAYISFRYAHNLAHGDGLVFNAGDRLEGFTNFLWTLLMVPFEAAGLDLFQVSEVLGTALCIVMLVQMTLLQQHFHGSARHLAQLWGALWLATSSNTVLWATSGMEQPLAMALPFSSVYFLWQGRERQRPGYAAIGGVLMGLGCMTRPEIHAMAMVVGAYLLVDVVRTRSLSATTRSWLIAILAVTVPFHIFRVAYFGEWLPNTYYVKTGDSSLVWLSGLEKLREMFDFNHLGLLVVLAPAAFIDKRRTLEKLVLAAIAGGFMVYIVKVGVDEMHWHRLYLPALPFLVLLAALGLRNIVVWLGAALRHPAAPVALLALAWSVVVWAAWDNFKFTYKEMNGFNGRGDLAGTYHPDIGKFITRHERPGALVAFQDMGSTPYYAPDIAFLDFIGLVDRTVARARHSYGLHPFVATENYRNQKVYDADMRAYFREQAPEWAILTSYVGQGMAQRVAQDFERDPRRDHLVNRRSNGYQFDIESEPWFGQHYVHVRTWPRSATYYLSLYRRRDLYEQIPGEVVLDEVPDGPGGPTARFAGGLELLGVEVEREAMERGEFFVTTWWRAPGPMDPDTYIFLHLNREGYQAPYDHLPGDWLYPADRWRAGDIIEDRVLVQIPVNAEPGDYALNLGVWNRRTGERLAIEQGPDDGQRRIALGSVHVRAMRLFLDHLIPPTIVEEQRKYPERIIDPGRPETRR